MTNKNDSFKVLVGRSLAWRNGQLVRIKRGFYRDTSEEYPGVMVLHWRTYCSTCICTDDGNPDQLKHDFRHVQKGIDKAIFREQLKL